MTETFAALLFAHVAADFLLQTNGMAARKKEAPMLLLHGLLVLLTAYAAIGRLDVWEPLALTAAHLVIDAVKAHALPDRLWSFFADQVAHLLTLIACAAYAPTLFAGGLWTGADWVPGTLAMAAGLITATVAGGHVVAYLVSRWGKDVLPEGLPNAGRLIGLLERGIIFILILFGQPASIGFLIAAKSVLRFDTRREQHVSEYVIVGTLASFGWAMAVTWATLVLMAALPPLGIPTLTP